MQVQIGGDVKKYGYSFWGDWGFGNLPSVELDDNFAGSMVVDFCRVFKYSSKVINGVLIPSNSPI